VPPQIPIENTISKQADTAYFSSEIFLHINGRNISQGIRENPFGTLLKPLNLSCIVQHPTVVAVAPGIVGIFGLKNQVTVVIILCPDVIRSETS